MEPCGCKGVRSCLLCEAKGLKPLPPSFSDVPRSTFTQCHRCGELFLGAGDIMYCPVTSCTPKKIWNPCLTASGANFEGVTVVQDFVSPQEEEEAIQVIDQQRWVESQSGRRKQDYGPKVNFKRRKVKLGCFTGLPSFSERFVKRLQSEVEGMEDFVPVELCNLDYRPERGAAIDPHTDDTWLWGERLVTLNLLSDTTLTFSHQGRTSSPTPSKEHTTPSQAQEYVPGPTPSQCVDVRIFMPRRSLIVVQGSARYQWQHSIQRADVTARRVAVTLRELSKEFLPGGTGYEPTGKAILQAAALYNGQQTNSVSQIT